MVHFGLVLSEGVIGRDEDMGNSNNIGKRLSPTLAFVAALLLFSACGQMQGGEDGGQVEAYLAVFRQSCPLEDYYYFPPDGSTVYVGVDLSQALYSHPERIQKEIESYVEGSRLSIIWGDWDAMVDLGRIVLDRNGEQFFAGGFFFSYVDVSLTDDTLVTNASVWYGMLAASGATYTVKKAEGEWLIADTSDMWIS
ncbi:MAG: hypothetical protein LBE83_02725 [Propionibacteriaceae bacterium]|nr:hypothetical protein [Propionibacteriaceae bacterium]